MDKLISADKLSQALRDDLNIPGREFARVKRHIDEIIDGTAKPMTNADCIRAMSDEELANLLCELCWNGENCYTCPLFSKSCGGLNGLSGWIDWAKQPAEVDDG